MTIDGVFLMKTKPTISKAPPTPSRCNVGDLFTKYQKRLKLFIRGRGVNKYDVEDILQDVFYQLAKTADDSIDSIEHMSAWLYRVTRNRIVNYYSKKRETGLPFYTDNEENDKIASDFSDILFDGEEEADPSPETQYLRSLVWVELENALSELPAEQRQVFILTELEGIPVKEISKSTGVPVTLLSRKHYAVVHLRKRLHELYNDLMKD